MLTSKFDERVRREMEYSSRGDVIRSRMCFKEKREDYNRDIYIYKTNVLLNEKAKARYYWLFKPRFIITSRAH